MSNIAVLTPVPSADPTARWSLRLQQRVMRLLLLHDRRLFRGQFHAFFAGSALPPLPLFAQYQRHIRLLTLSDELLGDIMPRIRRQLSLLTSQTRLREEAPTRGDIDWRRTIERGWQETPGLAPTEFDTRLRQRSTATPENTLVVAVLLAYRREIAGALREHMQDEALTDDERQVLVGHDERAECELAAAYARTLVPAAQAADIAVLVDNVAARLRPGPNPYRDLIAWWQQFQSLRVGRSAAERALALSSQRDDEKTDAWLYELWIALEFIHVLQQAHAITTDDTQVATDTLQFGLAWRGRRFRFRYNRQLEPAGDGGTGWVNGPASRPDYTIERAAPLEVRYNNTTLIWREPPVVLDAKYYLRGHDPARTHGPIKKVFGDMLLLGAQHGGLFFPLLLEPAEGVAHTRIIQRDEQRHHGGMGITPEMRLYRLAPDMPFDQLQARLHAVLDHAAAQLPERPPVACHGMWIDADSINASHTHSPAGTLVCPKPHIGPGVYDLVNIERDCLKNPRLCHVIGQPIIPPLVMRATTRAELDQRAHETRARHDQALTAAERHNDDGERAEQLRSHIFTGIGGTVEQYVKLRGNTAMIEELFERWVFGEYWREHPRCLSETTRRMLLSGEYVWQEYNQTTLDDWAAPAIQFCRALEHELKRRTYDATRTPGYHLRSAGWTLGTPLHAYRHKNSPDSHKAHNWNVILTYVHSSHSDPAAFTTMIQRIENGQVGNHRNTLAYSNAAQKPIAEIVRAVIIGDRRQPGVLPWIVEHLSPIV